MWKSRVNNVNKMVGIGEGFKKSINPSPPVPNYPQLSFKKLLKTPYYTSLNPSSPYSHP